MRAKKFIAAAVFAAVALFSGINAYNNSNKIQLSDLALANVEALAYDGEGGEGGEDGVAIMTCYPAFSNILDTRPNFSCSGTSNTGVIYECGAISNYQPLIIVREYKCYNRLGGWM